jgi:D-alanine-D-alanine ligase-like ATP-grasp enzyme
LARKAYISVGGTGYGRVDIRTRTPSSKDGFVLEVNANCGLAFGRMASSLGEILILSKVEPDEFCREIINYAVQRFEA